MNSQKPKFLYKTKEIQAAVRMAKELGWVPDPSAGGKAKAAKSPTNELHKQIYAQYQDLMKVKNAKNSNAIKNLAAIFCKSESQIYKIIAKQKKSTL